MSEKNKQYLIFAVMTVVISALTVFAALNGIAVVLPQPPAPEARGFQALSREDIQWAVIDKLTVLNDSELRGDASVAGGLTVTGNLAVSGAQATGESIVLEGSTADEFEATISVVDPTADNALTIADVSGALHVDEATQPLIASNAEIGGGFSGGSGTVTGCSITAAGNFSCDGAAYVRSTLGVTGAVTTTAGVSVGTELAAAQAEIGGGFGGGYAAGSGCSITSAGLFKCDGAAYFRSTLGVTGAVTVTGNTDLAGTLQYGANDLYPVGYASSGKAIVQGQATTIAVGSVDVVHGLTGVDSVVVSICQKPTPAIAHAAAVITATTVTLEAWDSTVSSQTNGALLCYTIIGTK